MTEFWSKDLQNQGQLNGRVRPPHRKWYLHVHLEADEDMLFVDEHLPVTAFDTYDVRAKRDRNFSGVCPWNFEISTNR